MNAVAVALFGAFRRHDPAEIVTLHVPDGATVADVRAALAAHLPPDAAPLLADAAFADDERVLHDDEPVLAHARLAVLPPVCGG